MKRHTDDTDKNLGILFTIACLFLLWVFIISPVISYNTQDEMTITVKDKSINTQGKRGYLVFTDKGVLSNRDSFVLWKWDSSDVQNELEVGHTYQVKVHWLRVPFFSWYKNIIKIEHEDQI